MNRQAHLLALAIVRQDAMRLDELNGQQVHLSLDDLRELYHTIGIVYMGETTTQRAEEVLGVYFREREAGE